MKKAFLKQKKETLENWYGRFSSSNDEDRPLLFSKPKLRNRSDGQIWLSIDNL